MSDAAEAGGVVETAGALLRAARERQGLHVAALATLLKVPPRKLEALEADRYEELQGATFVRALAQAACRTLKIDPAPVLERLPRPDTGTLNQLDRGLNAPFRERSGAPEGLELQRLASPVLWGVLLLLAGAAAFWFWPSGPHPWPLNLLALKAPAASEAASGSMVIEPIAYPAPAASLAASGPATALATGASEALAGTPAASPAAATPAKPSSASQPAVNQAAAPAAASSAAAAPSAQAARVPPAAASTSPTLLTTTGPLRLRARAASWVEVVDGQGRLILGRTLLPGETVALDGALPMRVKIGNVAGTDVTFRGQPVGLSDDNGDNVARLELK